MNSVIKGNNFTKELYRKMTVSWLFSYSSMVKNLEVSYIRLRLITRCVIKGLHCT